MKLLSLIKRLVDVGVAPGQIAKPSNVTRRDFLKACGITAASVYMGGMTPRQESYVMGVDYGNGNDYSAVRGIVAPNLLTDEAMYLPSSEECFNRDEAIRLNELLFQKLASVQPDQATLDAVNSFTRTKLQEDGFFRRLMPPVPISNEDLDQVVDEVPAKPSGLILSHSLECKTPFDMVERTCFELPRVDIPETTFQGTPKADQPNRSGEIFGTDWIVSDSQKPAVISNQHFKLKVEGTHANQTIADQVAAHFGSRPATPEQIAAFVRGNLPGYAKVSVSRDRGISAGSV